MSATAAGSHQPGITAGRLHYAIPVLGSEWDKLRTTRSTLWTAAIGGAVSIVLSTLHAVAATHLGSSIDAVGAGMFGLTISQFIAAIAGVLAITNEYASGTIFLSLIATPRRPLLLTAKTVVLATSAFVYGLLISATSFAIVSAILAHTTQDPASGSTAVRRLVGAATIFTAMSLIGLALGAITRSTAGGLIGTVAVLALPKLLLDPVNARIRSDISRFLPFESLQDLIAASPSPHTLRPLAAFGVLVLELGGLLTLAGCLLYRRDA